MKLLKIIMIITLIIVLFNCSKQDKNKEIEISDEIMNKLKSIESYKELFTKISSKKLENPNNRFLYFNDIQENEHYIVAKSSSPNGIYYWNKKGEYIGQIGEKGKGPGEYLYANIILINDNKLLLIDSSLRRISFFNLQKNESQFDDMYKFENISSERMPFFNFAFYKENKIYLCNLFSRPDTYRIYILDENLKFIKKIFESRKRAWMGNTGMCYVSNCRIFILDDIWHDNHKNALKGDFNCSGDLFIYDLNGKFIKKINLDPKKILEEMNAMIVDKSGKLLLINNKYLVDINGNEIKKFDNKITNNELPVRKIRNYFYTTKEKYKIDDEYLILNKYEFDLENL